MIINFEQIYKIFLVKMFQSMIYKIITWFVTQYNCYFVQLLIHASYDYAVDVQLLQHELFLSFYWNCIVKQFKHKS